MAREMALTQQAHTGDPAGVRELMPARLSERVERASLHYAFKSALQRRPIRERTRVAALRLNHPFDATYKPIANAIHQAP